MADYSGNIITKQITVKAARSRKNKKSPVNKYGHDEMKCGISITDAEEEGKRGRQFYIGLGVQKEWGVEAGMHIEQALYEYAPGKHCLCLFTRQDEVTKVTRRLFEQSGSTRLRSSFAVPSGTTQRNIEHVRAEFAMRNAQKIVFFPTYDHKGVF